MDMAMVDCRPRFPTGANRPSRILPSHDRTANQTKPRPVRHPRPMDPRCRNRANGSHGRSTPNAQVMGWRRSGVGRERCRQYAEHWFRVSRGQD